MFKKLLVATSLFLVTSIGYAHNMVVGKDYIPVKVDSRNVLATPTANKPLVIEFFWYGCPHCYHMEPLVKKLIADRKGDFTYKRYPVVFPHWESGAKLYFTIEAMGLVDKLHDKIFYTIQEKKLNIMDDKLLRDAFLKSEGIDVVKFNQVYNSFGVNLKMNEAKAYPISYKIDSSPTFVVNNLYEINPALTKSYVNTITSVNNLLDNIKASNK
jgi:thiol:disulfide interchange protein DsbA